MDFDDSREEAAFRAEAREWLRAHAPAFAGEGTTVDTASLTVEDQDEHERAELARAVAWQHELCEHGWAGITWPKEYGGRGGTSLQHTIFAEEMATFDLPQSQAKPYRRPAAPASRRPADHRARRCSTATLIRSSSAPALPVVAQKGRRKSEVL